MGSERDGGSHQDGLEECPTKLDRYIIMHRGVCKPEKTKGDVGTEMNLCAYNLQHSDKHLLVKLCKC